jgi:FecR protein
MIGRRSNYHSFLLFAFILCLANFGLENTARAESSSTTRAARLTYLQGTVTINQADNTASEPAQLNLPLLAGVRLSTGEDGQAEVEFEDGSVVRLTPNSILSLDNLTVESGGVFTTDLSLLHGLAYLELRATAQYRYTLNAGGDILSPVENATVRVNFDQSPAIFAVLDGTVHIERQGGPDNDSANAGYQADVRAGESLRVDSADPNRYFLTQVIAGESWDRWNEDLDKAAAAEAANSTEVRNNYAGAQGYGWSDLDANGSWYDVPGQGPVWQPQAAAVGSGFDPYGNGAWVSYPGTGYVWASGYSWGWTPYRCGNWSYFTDFGWGWAPGSGCGGRGWGFAAGGRPVNIGHAPYGYQLLRIPEAGRSPARPILPIRLTSSAPRSTLSDPVEHAPRRIAGVTVAPIEPVRSGFNQGGEVVGSSLRRDYPVDSRSRTPVLGLAATRPSVIHAYPGQRPAADRPDTAERPAMADRPVAIHPPYTGQSYPGREQSRPAQGVRSEPSSPQYQRPLQQSAPPQRSASPPAEHPTYSQPAPSHPTYSPPPASAPAHPTSSSSPAPNAPARSR